MKYAEYIIENHKVAVYNSLIGVESILLNGREVSKGFSWFGRDHFFKIDGNQYTIRPHISLKNYTGVGIKVYKNRVPIAMENHITKADKRNLIVQSIISVVLGIAIGLSLGWAISVIVEVLFKLALL